MALNYPRTYAQTGEIAAFRPVRRPARTAKIGYTNGRTTLDGDPYPIFWTSMNEGSSIPKVDAEMIATLKRIVSDGYNGLMLHGVTERKWTESSSNWGVWEYDNNDVSYTNRWSMVEDALVQLDKMIAYALDYGIEAIWISLEGYDEITLRHPNQMSGGTYQSRGMMWSDVWRDMQWDVNSRIIERVNTIDGMRYVDNPRIIWRFNNENSFANGFTRSTTNAWGGGSSVQWFQKIIDGTTDTLGANGEWYAELNAKLTAWKDVYAPSWSIPAWGRGGSGVADGAVGFPSRGTWYNWATGADPTTDKNNIIDFISYNEVEYITDLLTRMRALRSDVVVGLGTFGYLSPVAHLGLSDELMANTFVDTHHYFEDGVSVGVKSGSVVTRKSITNTSWAYVLNGGGFGAVMGGVYSPRGGFISSECGQYGPNRWRYQRLYYEAIIANLNGFDISTLSQSQQYSTAQFTTDGRLMQSDHVCVGSPCERLSARALAPMLRNGFISEHSSTFAIQSSPSSLATKQHSLVSATLYGFEFNAGYSSDGSENAWAGTKKVTWDIDDTYSQTTDFSTFPKVTDATFASGTYLKNTATEKVYVKGNYGAQVMTPYMNLYLDTITDSPVFTMPMTISSMAGAETCSVCHLRSDGLYPLFTGPMKLYIHGSEYSTDLVQQGLNVTAGTIEGVAPGAYGQASTDAFASHNPPGPAYFAANDGVTLYYAGASSQTWGSGNSTAAATYLMMPAAFTVNLDTTNGGALPGTDLEIFGVTNAGVPVRLASTYDSGTGAWSFNYDGTYPEYIVQPKVINNVLSHLEAP